MAGKIEELFSFGFNDLIWETSLDKSTGNMLIQNRSEEKHETRFSVVNLHIGEWIVRDRIFSDPWWVGISAIMGQRVLLHIYDDDQNPEIKSLILWDIEKDQVLMTFKNSSLTQLLKNGFMIRQDQGYAAMDWDGQILADKSEMDPVLEDTTNLHYPFQYQPGENDYEMIKSFIQQEINVSPELGIEYLESEDYVFVSYYIKEEKAMANYLLVSDLNGTTHLNKKINTGSTGIGRDTFFIFERNLVFISNSNCLFVYAI